MKSYLRTLADIKEKYDIDVVIGEDRLEMEIGYVAPKPTIARDYIEFFLAKELSIYPKDIIKKSKVARIVLCDKIASCGRHYHGLADMKVLILPFKRNTIYLNVRSKRNSYDRATVHHELFHAIDFHDDWSRYTDFEWPKLNESGFEYARYLGGGNAPYDGNGFVSTYSKCAVHEDKAELYAHLIVNHSGVEARTRKDPILKAKTERIKQLLSKFSSAYNDDFWQRRITASVPVY